ncbi:MAG: WD40 repeat domain-containing protein, partial [Myxococcales bacterium]|nr:WD40 repeat domain-containing protein [Myxococcales bacterium]
MSEALPMYSRAASKLATFIALACVGCGASSAPAHEPNTPNIESAGKSAHPIALALDGAHPERIKLRWQEEIGGRGVAVAVERKSARVAAVVEGSPVKLYDYWSGKSAGVSATCTDVLRGGVYLLDGKLIVVCASRLELYQVKGMKELPAPTLAESPATAATLVWPWLAVGHHDGVIRLYNLQDDKRLEIAVPGPPIDVKSLALSKDGSTLAVAWVQGSIWWWKVSEPEVPHPLTRYESESDALTFDSTGQWLAEEGEKSLTSVWSFEGEPSRRYQRKHGAWIKRMHFTRDGKWLLRGGSHGVDLVEVAGEHTLSLAAGLVEDVALDPDQTSVAAVDRKGRLSL